MWSPCTRACSRLARSACRTRTPGEAVKLFVVRKDPALTAEALIRHCRENLTGYKVPRHIEFRNSLPKSPVGKILRRELREAAKA